MHVEAMPDGKENPYGNGFVGVETALTSEGSACRVADASKGTYWKINNPVSRHASTGNSPSCIPADLFCSDTLYVHTDPDGLPSFAEECSFGN